MPILSLGIFEKPQRGGKPSCKYKFLGPTDPRISWIEMLKFWVRGIYLRQVWPWKMPWVNYWDAKANSMYTRIYQIYHCLRRKAAQHQGPTSSLCWKGFFGETDSRRNYYWHSVFIWVENDGSTSVPNYSPGVTYRPWDSRRGPLKYTDFLFSGEIPQPRWLVFIGMF